MGRRKSSAFTEILLSCHASLYRYARALCHDPPEAEELVQETYRRALSAKRKPAPLADGPVRRWMFTIMRHIWQNELRHRQHDVRRDPSSLLAANASPGESPEETLLRKALQHEVRQAVDALPARFREVIALRELEGLSYSEIAGILECPLGTVMSRLARARALLRQLLGSPAAWPKESER